MQQGGGMDVGRSFTYVTQDPKWISKLLIAAAVGVVPILSFALVGYTVEITRRVYTGQPQPLPEWDEFGDLLVRGLVVSLGLFIWSIPLIALFGCGIAAAFAADQFGSAGVLALCVLTPLAMLIGAFVFPVVFARYAIEREFAAMLDVGAVLAETRNAVGPLAIATILAIAVLFGALVVGTMLCLVGALVTFPYAYLVIAHLYGQAYREARPAGTAVAQRF